MHNVGAVLLRPYHLTYASACGLKGFAEPARAPKLGCRCFIEFIVLVKDTHQLLCELIVARGPWTYTSFFLFGEKGQRPSLRFLSNPDRPGTEKLAITALRPEAGIVPPHNISASDIGVDADVLAPMNCMMVKGWSRSLAALTVMTCLWKCEKFQKARVSENGFGRFGINLSLACVIHLDSKTPNCCGRYGRNT